MGPTAIPPGLDTFGQVVGNYKAAAIAASAALTPHAEHLLMTLFAIELIYTACLWSLSARSAYEILEQMCRRGIAIGLIYWFLANAVSLLGTLFNGFQWFGQTAIGVSNLTPTGVLTLGIQMAGTIVQSFTLGAFFTGLFKSGSDPVLATLLVLATSLIVLIAFTLAAAWFLTTFIEMYLVIGGGSILIALGGSEITGAIFQRFLSKVIALGIRGMFIILTLGVGMQLANGWLAAIQTASAITPAMLFYLIANAVMFLLVVLAVPHTAASLANDSVSFGLAQAFEATWLAATIARGVQRGLSAAKHATTLNAGRARVAKASAAHQAAAQMPGVQPNYPPPPPPPTTGNAGPRIGGPPDGGFGGTPALSGPTASANGTKDHKTLDLDQWKRL
jgi:P-type conjugative transfer protein TrbL